MAAGLGLVLMIWLMYVDYRVLRRPEVIYGLLGGVLFLLIAVLFMPELNNTRRWFHFGGISLQPSELGKLALRIEDRANDPRRSFHTNRSCHNCHSSQERTTMALRRSHGEAPREFEYFFRAFGYFSSLPFISRRLIQEAQFTANELDVWDKEQEF